MLPLNVFHPTKRFGISLAFFLAVFFSFLLSGCGGGGYGGGSMYTTPTLTSITITPSSGVVIIGASATTAQLTATGNYSNGTTADLTTLVTWTSVAPGTASVGSSTGLVTGVAVGTTNITAAMPSLYGTITSPAASITVTDATLQSIAITPATISIGRGNTTIFTATGTFSNSTTGNISGSVIWTSSDTTVATIDARGIATGVGLGTLGTGTCNITATLNGITDTVTLTVL